MATTNTWLNNHIGSVVTQTGFTSAVVMTRSQLLQFAEVSNLVTPTALVFGDIYKWLLQIMYFPIQFKPAIRTDGITKNNLRAGGILYEGAENQGYLDGDALTSGYTLGEYLYPACSSFLDYEPYKTVEVFLPYYGFVPLKISDIQGKYIQFRMYVDFLTGMAQYAIGVNGSSVSTPNAPYCYGANDKYTRIIGTYNFQLGTAIPISNTGIIDSSRNIILGVAKAAVSVASGIVMGGVPSATQTATTTETNTWTTRNPNTGRQVTSQKVSRNVTSKSSTYHNNAHSAVNTAIETGAMVLGNLSSTPHTTTTNNAALNINLSQSVFIITRRVQSTQLDYFGNLRLNHLKGLPLGDTYQLKNLHGFTTVSDIQLEGDGFKTATSYEKDLLMSAVSSGVILPEES